MEEGTDLVVVERAPSTALAEEMQSPIGMRLYREADERAKYVPPTGE